MIPTNTGEFSLSRSTEILIEIIDNLFVAEVLLVCISIELWYLFIYF